MKIIKKVLPNPSGVVPRHRTFSFRLLLNFAVSSLFPFIIIISLTANIYSSEYSRDMNRLTKSHLESLATNLTIYLDELNQITLIPYYNEDFSYYFSDKNAKKQLSFEGKLSIRQSLDNLLSFIRYTRTDIQSAVIVTEETCMYHTTNINNSTPTPNYNYAEEEWFQEAMEHNGSVIFLGPHIQSYFSPKGKENVFSLVRSLVNIRTRKAIAVMKVDATTTIFDDLLQDADFSVSSELFITDSNGTLIYSKNHNEQQIAKLLNSDDIFDLQTVNLGSRKMTHNYLPIKDYGWNLHILLSTEEMNSRTFHVYFIGIAMYLVGLLLAMFFYYGKSKRLVQSISQMKETLVRVQHGDFSAHYDYTENDELAVLGESLNKMTRQLDEKIQQEYLATIRQKDSEMRALQAQIQPHFLFNTLNGMIALNQAGSSTRLEQALFSLCSMLRYVLDKRTVVTLGEELEFLKSYNQLQQLRFGDRFKFDISCDEQSCIIEIPRLLLQPFAENALTHGIEPCKKECILNIRAEVENCALQIIISDNGVGFDDQIKGTGMGIGIQNSKERLRLVYPESSIDINGRPDEGCTVFVRIPLS